MHAVKALCAGSLRDVMEEMAASAFGETGLKVLLEFGPSGLLRKRIEDGEPAGLLASADMGHPEALFRAGLARKPVVFCANAIRVMSAPEAAPPRDAESDPAALVEWLLKPSVRLSTSTPGADPSGDYAMKFFALAEKAVPGARAALEAKAVKAVGGCGPKLSNGVVVKRPVARLFEEDRTDAFVGYATTALQTAESVPGLHVLTPPKELSIRCPYGLAVMSRPFLSPGSPVSSDSPDLSDFGDPAALFARFMLSKAGQNIFAAFGFLPPNA